MVVVLWMQVDTLRERRCLEPEARILIRCARRLVITDVVELEKGAPVEARPRCQPCLEQGVSFLLVQHLAIHRCIVVNLDWRDIVLSLLALEQSEVRFDEIRMIGFRDFIKVLKHIFRNEIVWFHDADILSTAEVEPLIHRAAIAAVFFVHHADARVFLCIRIQHLRRRVRRAIVHAEDFDVRERLTLDARQAFLQILLLIVNRHDDRYSDFILIHVDNTPSPAPDVNILCGLSCIRVLYFVYSL